MKGENLVWDSKFFGYSIHKVFLDPENDSDSRLDAYILAHKPDLLYLFSPKKHPSLEEKSVLMDEKTTFIRKVGYSPLSSVKSNLTILPYAGDLVPPLEELAWESGSSSRFKKDARLSPKFKELYSLWMKKSLEREIADAVFVCYDGQIMAGMVSVQKIEVAARLGIIAVHPSCRGRRIGEMLMRQAEAWCIGQQLEWLHVVTQGNNASACNFYRSMGYTVKSVEYVYHYWIRNK